MLPTARVAASRGRIAWLRGVAALFSDALSVRAAPTGPSSRSGREFRPEGRERTLVLSLLSHESPRESGFLGCEDAADEPFC